MQGLANVLLSISPQSEGFQPWLQQVVAAARQGPGFRDSEEFPATPGLQDRWVLILRFQSEEALSGWLHSEARQQLLDQGATYAPQEQVIAGVGSSSRPVTLVVPTRITPEQVSQFKSWQQDMAAMERTFPGHLESRLVEPASGDEWTILVRFDSKEHVDAWLQSPQRQGMMSKIDSAFHGDGRKVVVDFGGWFEAAPDEARPASWKQMLSVLIAIYPVVMSTMLFVDPRLKSLNMPLALAVLRDNLLSCCLLTWLIMPRLTGALSFWLQPRPKQPGWWEPAGTALVLAIVGVWTALFYWLTR